MNITAIITLVLLITTSVFAEKTPGVTDNSITLGQSAAFKGSSSSLGSELWRGAQAYFNFINASGGVNGRKIKVISYDDSYDGNKTISNTIKLIRKDKVFALFGYVGTPTIVKALPVVQRFSNENLFLFSNFTGAQPQREPPHKNNVFNVRSSYRHETAGLVNHLVKIGIKKIGVFIQHDAYGRSGADGVERALKKHGLNIISETTYKRGAVYEQSMRSQAEILIADGVEAIISIGSYAACAALIRDAKTSGFKGPIANVSFVGANALLNLLKKTEKRLKVNLTKNLINSQVVPPWDDVKNQLVAEYQKIMDKYPSKVPTGLFDKSYAPQKYGFVSLEGFLNAKIFVEILRKAPKVLTRSNFIKTTESTSALDIGLTEKISFSKNKHQGLNSVFYTTIKDGKYSTVKKWEKFSK